MNKELLIFDFETTGLDPKSCEIIEMGLLYYKWDGSKYIEDARYDLLIKQNKPLPDFIKNLTHITDEMLAEKGITKSEACQIFMKHYSKDLLLCGYNVQFDFSFLKAFLTSFNPKFELNNDILDVMAIYKDFYPYPHKLVSAIEMLKVEGINSHRAIDDVEATYNLLLALATEIPQKFSIPNFTIDAYINKIGMNPKYPLSTSQRYPHIKYLFQNGGGTKQELWLDYISEKK